jgi:hypothetical protein
LYIKNVITNQEADEREMRFATWNIRSPPWSGSLKSVNMDNDRARWWALVNTVMYLRVP